MISINNPCLNKFWAAVLKSPNFGRLNDSFSLRPQGKHDYPNHVYNESTEECSSKHIKTTMHLKASYQTPWNWRLDWQPSSFGMCMPCLYHFRTIQWSQHRQILSPNSNANAPIESNGWLVTMLQHVRIFCHISRAVPVLVQNLHPFPPKVVSLWRRLFLCSPLKGHLQHSAMKGYRRIRRHLWRFWRL